MSRNIVICSDGTGSTFDAKVTNVTRLVQCLDLDDAGRQVATYDQGVGTSVGRADVVTAYRSTLGDHDALRVLAPPLPSESRAKSALDRTRGLLFGHGLKQNVREMYRALAEQYDGPDDAVFLFGFSRGAFTVRALAGLVFRCGLPNEGTTDVDRRFDEAWALFEPMHPDEAAVRALWAGQRPGVIHFLGLWDTVKSYGGIDPVMLPHLRHNPIVTNVRHAVGLDERRAWFKPTTWGRLDIDEDGAMTRLRAADLEQIRHQDIAEVWFAGCHADIGGGRADETTSRVALRWMVGEAANVSPGLRLNEQGRALLRERDPKAEPQAHQSYRAGWRIAEQLPRYEIDNSGDYPVKRRVRGSDGRRTPDQLRRGGTISLHSTVARTRDIPGPVDVRSTQPLPG